MLSYLPIGINYTAEHGKPERVIVEEFTLVIMKYFCMI